MGRRLACATALVAAVALVLTLGPAGGRVASAPAIAQGATAEAGGQETVAETDDSLPLNKVSMIGSSPAEAPDETWGIARSQTTGVPYQILHYTPEEGWTLGPQLLDAEKHPLTGFEPDQPSGLSVASPLAGQITADGSGVLVGTAPPPGGGSPQQVILVRNPGNRANGFAETPAPGEDLHAGETLFPTRRAPLIAPIDEETGRAGAFVVPFNAAGTQDAVLHWTGAAWEREEIEVPGTTPEEKEKSGFQVLGIGASTLTNAWLLAQPSPTSETLALYRRSEGAWKPVSPAPIEVKGEALYIAGSPERVESQLLTVTGEGVWIDGVRPSGHEPTTVFFTPEGSLAGNVKASWCATPPVGEACDHPLPQDLPSDLPAGPSRSFAWANTSAGPYGERVITGIQEGVSLRLEGETFRRVLALGGSQAPDDVGATYGAAFSSATDGWLGSETLPVHLTLARAGEGYGESSVKPWPVPFRHALFAVAPQPGAPVGALCSEALAVGDSGEVGRYKVRAQPGGKCAPEGWQPETLFGPGGRRETSVRLRAVAWPTPNRAYAVGDESNAGHPQMWLWRGETDLWEPDPAIPLNFRGSLLGIAFDPEEPSRGYAVGSDGVLLRYGKTWTQEAALPEAAQGASFTSIAFAGAQALVAFHKNVEGHGRVGGLLVNDGSGWHLEEAAAAAMGGNVPTTVAALPDGGAAVATTGQGAARVYERSGSGAPWTLSPPLPPGPAPGSLALYRDGGALRAIVAGVAPVGEQVIPAPPPGFPPTIEEPLPVPSAEQQRGIVRQTSTGWEDEEHELNLVREPPGAYKVYDTVYQPDPIDALLIGSNGSEGWAVGGEVDAGSTLLDTSDAERYEANPGEQPVPPGSESSEPATVAQDATFAIGGGAGCAAPCAARANAKIGPDVWLASALRGASRIHGVRAFLYTGPRLSKGETEGPEPQYPFSQEFARYGELAKTVTAQSPNEHTLPVFVAASPTDLDNRPTGGAEADFEESFAGSNQISQPLGSAAPPSGISPVSSVSQNESCAKQEGCEGLYYSFDSEGEGGRVRVVVLDDTRTVEETQLKWLEGQLSAAAAANEPAIVIGNANLPAEVAAHQPEAERVSKALEGGGASAYFYDSPEENVFGSLGNVKTFGSGTLGYVEAHNAFAQFQTSGFLLVQVGKGARASVTASVIPNIGELALEAESGTLLRTSQVAVFSALARRPRAGNDSARGQVEPKTDPYIRLPVECEIGGCPPTPEYEFTSSNEQVGGFVERNTASPEPNVPKLTESGVTIPDPQSGLFCAYEKGETTVTIKAGLLASSLKVIVQAGSKRRPCVPAHPAPRPAQQQQQAPVPPPPAPAPSPSPAGSPPAAAPLLLPPPPAIVPPAAARPAPTPAAPPFVSLAAPTTAPLAFVPPPVPTPARPTPPSGTSAVTSPVEVAESEEEQEEAPESVSNRAVAYSAPEQEPPPIFVLGIVVLAALAGASVRRRGRSGRREVRVAPATVNGARQQRRHSRDGRGWL